MRSSALAESREEIFRSVSCLKRVSSLDETLDLWENEPLANASSSFKTNHERASTFESNVDASTAGVNIDAAASMSTFDSGGANRGFFGDERARRCEAADICTNTRVDPSRPE